KLAHRGCMGFTDDPERLGQQALMARTQTWTPSSRLRWRESRYLEMASLECRGHREQLAGMARTGRMAPRVRTASTARMDWTASALRISISSLMNAPATCCGLPEARL